MLSGKYECDRCYKMDYLADGLCLECYQATINIASKRRKLYDWLIDYVPIGLTFAAIFTVNDILMRHLGYSSLEQYLQCFALGWLTSKFVRTY